MSRSLLTQRSLPLLTAVGGWRTVAEGVLARALYLVAYLVSGRIVISALIALAAVCVFAVVRACTDRKYWQAAAGLILVGVSAVLAGSTGHAADCYLPAVVLQLVAGSVFLLSLLLRWPVIGLVVETARGGRFGWRRDPARRRRYRLCTAAFLAKFGIASLLLVPLYAAGQVTALGIASTLLAAPANGLCVYLCWRILRGHPLGPRPAPAATEAGLGGGPHP